jgi:transcriptional accessory protein Tex/SPT6
MGLLQNHVIPQLHREIKQDLYKSAEKEVISQCGLKFRAELNKGPALKRDGKPPTVLALVLEHDKLGMAVVSPDGELLFKGIIKVSYESSIEFIVKDKVLNDRID